ncbi:MAG: hypothetical protein HYW45_03965 [Candidatus Daviesbacteria bacterium]|nr:MAG: hypothetical protein HYW45_03965 [Candidatus Daviesbacteria bacterium]
MGSHSKLRKSIYQNLLDLCTEEGITASSREEIFGCIFGRDTALTVLKILRVHSKNPSLQLLETARKALLTMVALQGNTHNLESGEQPGKFIHEYRTERFEHLLILEKPWFVYPDGALKNYDSLDCTPLTLIAIYKYWQITEDSQFLLSVLPAVEAGLNWLLSCGDLDQDGLVEYNLPKRAHGGLVVQSWTDSHESIRQADGFFPKYPIAPVEVQAFAWLALWLWAHYFELKSPKFAKLLQKSAQKLKKAFNKKFIINDKKLYYGAQALDGDKKPIKTITGNPLLCLWATLEKNGRRECILEGSYIGDFVARAFKKDLFDPEAGIRTMSTKSPTFNPNQDCYHNGSFWPILNGLIHEGLEIWGFAKEAKKLKQASLKAILYFGTPLELYIKNGQGLLEYQSPTGQQGCRVQAWSAAATLDLIT